MSQASQELAVENLCTFAVFSSFLKNLAFLNLFRLLNSKSNDQELLTSEFDMFKNNLQVKNTFL